jgi:hypothetical protein
MTLEVVIYWIVLIFFALPIALGALLYIGRTFTAMFHAPREPDEEDDPSTDEYWKESEKSQDD